MVDRSARSEDVEEVAPEPRPAVHIEGENAEGSVASKAIEEGDIGNAQQGYGGGGVSAASAGEGEASGSGGDGAECSHPPAPPPRAAGSKLAALLVMARNEFAVGGYAP